MPINATFSRRDGHITQGKAQRVVDRVVASLCRDGVTVTVEPVRRVDRFGRPIVVLDYVPTRYDLKPGLVEKDADQRFYRNVCSFLERAAGGPVCVVEKADE